MAHTSRVGIHAGPRRPKLLGGINRSGEDDGGSLVGSERPEGWWKRTKWCAEINDGICRQCVVLYASQAHHCEKCGQRQMELTAIEKCPFAKGVDDLPLLGANP